MQAGQRQPRLFAQLPGRGETQDPAAQHMLVPALFHQHKIVLHQLAQEAQRIAGGRHVHLTPIRASDSLAHMLEPKVWQGRQHGCQQFLRRRHRRLFQIVNPLRHVPQQLQTPRHLPGIGLVHPQPSAPLRLDPRQGTRHIHIGRQMPLQDRIGGRVSHPRSLAQKNPGRNPATACRALDFPQCWRRERVRNEQDTCGRRLGVCHCRIVGRHAPSGPLG
mmetsp:Transcript_17967/g.27347  ORF Transcript_17967/g.27347 Transcript_17967/m.27347 type:complete len:219 (+) Transcript_17967:1022-1678(+)